MRLTILEGMDGAGKDTVIAGLRERFAREGKILTVFREPGGTEFGENIRSILLTEKRPSELDAQTLLFVAIRVELYRTQVLPALARGEVVLLNRSYPTSFAYNEKVNWDWIFDLHKSLGIFDIEHDIVYLDIDKETSRQRMGTRHQLDVIEKEMDVLFEKYYRNYQELFSLLTDKQVVNHIAVVDARQSPAQVTDEVFLQMTGEKHDSK